MKSAATEKWLFYELFISWSLEYCIPQAKVFFWILSFSVFPPLKIPFIVSLRYFGNENINTSWGVSRTAATCKMECSVIIVNSLPAVNYYHKALHLGCCNSPRFASTLDFLIRIWTAKNKVICFIHYYFIQERLGIFWKKIS